MSDLPFLDVPTAVAVGRRVVPAGPRLSASEIEAVVGGLRVAAAASVAPVEQVSGLSLAGADADAALIDRPTWVEANVRMAVTMLEEAAGPLPPPVTLGDRVAARVNAAQLAGALAVFGSRILGQYLPFVARPRLVLVAPNVAKLERALGVDPADFRLWVCLHERTHQAQFVRAPWLRSHLAAAVAPILSDAEGGPRPRELWRGSLTEVLSTPQQRAAFEHVSAVMALLEGYADDMMDRVGPEVVPSVATIRARFERRRRRGGVAALANRALGLDRKLAQYTEGAAFCRAVIAAVGVTGLNAVYEGPGHLPTPDEIRDPGRWVTRVHG